MLSASWCTGCHQECLQPQACSRTSQPTLHVSISPHPPCGWLLQHKCITSYICVYCAPPHKPRGCRVSAQSKAVHAALQTSFRAPDGSLMVQRLSRLLRNHLQPTSKAAWEFGTAGLRQLGCARAFSSAAPAPVESQANLGFVDGGYKVTDFPQDKARLRGPRNHAHLLV